MSGRNATTRIARLKSCAPARSSVCAVNMRRKATTKTSKSRGYQLVPKTPTHKMLRALAGEPLILSASEEAELRRRYEAMLEAWAEESCDRKQQTLVAKRR